MGGRQLLKVLLKVEIRWGVELLDRRIAAEVELTLLELEISAVWMRRTCGVWR